MLEDVYLKESEESSSTLLRTGVEIEVEEEGDPFDRVLANITVTIMTGYVIYKCLTYF
jgi:hypothetical protein